MKFDDNGLIPAIVQHARSGEVLMLGYMNEDALRQTTESGLVTFWSRSRGRLWQKGETSGNVLRLVELRQDCDGDALLVLAEPAGPTCHTGEPSCFHRALDGSPVERAPASQILTELADVIARRAAERPAGSYTTKLLDGGVDRIGKKIGEEAAEVIIAAKNGAPSELAWELSDLLYHSLVLLEQQGVPLEAIWRELRRRHGA
ncbi:MAG: bifunctional phosphoribosyl-AMP cyclohydrolase/phosphoribosyl-ATP diphosphatase HisIE [Chloroflexota bacterium]|uniref:bifunctional phosphoribosyl-AMP cyclohydrolase/phosphoribosyl-ATP diphosphatase HisIE n=1 Tax=uncultured Pigmentiphaga sp. TaxID=340361 RepID=UPI00263629C2|nr:bifunctional phosphoribosyl-AMP cyclohydrolase/phosphoribosyl-ATP diphosphatase HisIE [uncultured Pigmentiphaga sp.]